MVVWLLLAGLGVYVVAAQSKESPAARLVSAGNFAQLVNAEAPGASSSVFSRSQLIKWASALHAGGSRKNVLPDWSALTLDEIAQQGWLAFGNGVHVLGMGPARWQHVSEATAGLIAWEIYGREGGNLGNAALRLWEIQSWLLYYRYPGTPEKNGSFGAKRCKIRQKYTSQMIEAIQAAPCRLASHAEAESMGARSWLLASPVLCPRPAAFPAVFVGSAEEQEQTLEAVVSAFSHSLNMLFVLSLDATPYKYTAGDLLRGVLNVVTAGISAAFPAAAPAVQAGSQIVQAASSGDYSGAASAAASYVVLD